MDCRECKLTIADESLTTCPVCGGPLQPGTNEVAASQTEEEGGAGADAGEGGLDFYQKSVAQADDFCLADFGLEPSPPNQKDEGDILELADLWADKDLDTELEGLLADTFLLSADLSPSEKAESGVELENLVEFAAQEPDPAEPGKGFHAAEKRPKTLLGGVEPFADKPEPKIISSAARFSGLRGYVLLLLLLFVGVAGGWFFFRGKMTGFKEGGLRARPEAESAQVSNSRPEARALTLAVAASGPENSEPVGTKASGLSAEPVENAKSLTGDGGAEDKSVGVPRNPAVPREAGAIVDQVESPQVEAELPPPPAQELSVSVVSRPRALVSADSTGTGAPSPAKDGLKPAEEPAASSAVSPPQAVAVMVPESRKAEVALSAESAFGERASVAEQSAADSFAVHIGSFASREGAGRQAKMLEKKGFTVFLMEVDLGAKGLWWRVMVPGGMSLEDAKAVQLRLKERCPREDSYIRRLK